MLAYLVSLGFFADVVVADFVTGVDFNRIPSLISEKQKIRWLECTQKDFSARDSSRDAMQVSFRLFSFSLVIFPSMPLPNQTAKTNHELTL